MTTPPEPCIHNIVRNEETGNDECIAGCGWVIPAPPPPPQLPDPDAPVVDNALPEPEVVLE